MGCEVMWYVMCVTRYFGSIFKEFLCVSQF